VGEADDYKELAREVNGLRNDLAKSAAAGKFTASANRASIEEVKTAQAKLEHRLRVLEGTAPTIELRLSQLEETDKEHTGKIRTIEVETAKDSGAIEVAKTKEEEKTKRIDKQWGVYAAIATALITGILNLLMHIFGGS
jgi:SMC interacting uncharacterized protein involved in chromosome segregation